MHWGAFAGLGGVAAAVTAVVATGPEVHRYPITQSIARERLATTPVPDALLGMVGHKAVVIREPGGLLWQFGDAKSRSTGRVTLEADGASTNVTMSFDLADNAYGDSPIGKTRLSRSMAESMFLEHVHSVLGGRPFDAQQGMMKTAMEMQADPRIMEEYGQAIGDQFNQVATMLNESEEFSFSSVSQVQRGSSRAATAPNPESYRPTTDVSE